MFFRGALIISLFFRSLAVFDYLSAIDVPPRVTRDWLRLRRCAGTEGKRSGKISFFYCIKKKIVKELIHSMIKSFEIVLKNSVRILGIFSKFSLKPS